MQISVTINTDDFLSEDETLEDYIHSGFKYEITKKLMDEIRAEDIIQTIKQSVADAVQVMCTGELQKVLHEGYAVTADGGRKSLRRHIERELEKWADTSGRQQSDLKAVFRDTVVKETQELAKKMIAEVHEETVELARAKIADIFAERVFKGKDIALLG